jgi:hypothetical protein
MGHFPFDKMNNKVEYLEEVVRESNNISQINSGGCAINAVAIYDHIQEFYPELSPTIYYYGYGCNSEPIANRDTHGMKCRHAVVQIYVDGEEMWIESSGVSENICFDGDVIYPSEDMIDPVDRDLCIEHINSDCWNPKFDREINVRKIDEIFGTEVRFEVNGAAA